MKVTVSNIKYEFYDFPSVFFASRCESKMPPQHNKMQGVYGEFLWMADFVTLAERKYMESTSETFTEDLPAFRRDAMKFIINYSDPLYPEDDG